PPIIAPAPLAAPVISVPTPVAIGSQLGSLVIGSGCRSFAGFFLAVMIGLLCLKFPTGHRVQWPCRGRKALILLPLGWATADQERSEATMRQPCGQRGVAIKSKKPVDTRGVLIPAPAETPVGVVTCSFRHSATSALMRHQTTSPAITDRPIVALCSARD